MSATVGAVLENFSKFGSSRYDFLGVTVCKAQPGQSKAPKKPRSSKAVDCGCGPVWLVWASATD